MTSQVWLNGEFRTKPWTQLTSRAPESPPDQLGDEVSDLESGMSDSESEEPQEPVNFSAALLICGPFQ